MPGRHEQEPHREQEPHTYYLASEFLNERPSKRAYDRAQETLYHAPRCDLSVFRFLVRSRHTWLVTVIGEKPEEQLEQRLRRILASGVPTTVPEDVLQILQARRAEATQQAPWVERHFPPPTQN